jgi:DNA polymerase III epsilon subunit-like protein
MRIKPTDRQVVVDLETLSTHPNACIVSIGAVSFNLQDGILDEFFINVDATSSKSHGLHLDPNTIQWWQKQSIEAQKSWQTDPQPLDYALGKFADFYQKGNPIWGNGSSFDITILESAYYAIGWDKDKVYGNHLPWKFWDIYDMRTLTSILGKKLEKTGINHNALDDSIAEAKLLIEMLKS